MKIYFLSSQPCELTLNGIFFGITDRFERFVNVDLSDRIYASFSPQGALPVGVFLDDNLVHAPPEGVEIYLLQDAVAVYVKDFPPADCTLLPITQSRFDDTLVTVFKQGAVHLSIERGKELFISTLPPSFSNPTLSMHANFLFVEGENTLAVYTKDGKRIFFEQILSFFVEGTTLNATLPLSDRLNRVAECVWELEENGCTQTKFTIRQTGALPRQSSSISPCESTSQLPHKNSSMPSQNTEEDSPSIALPEDLFAYAFFESILLRADYTQFLSDELKSDADKIPTFLGEFIGVSLTNTPNVCGLIKKKNERVFEVIPFSIVVENGKIVDVKSDFFNKIP